MNRGSSGTLGLSNLQAVLSVQNGLAASVHLDLGDLDIRGVNANMDGLAVGLVFCAALHVDHVLLSVHRRDLALLALEATTQDADLVILADGERANLKNRNHVNLSDNLTILNAKAKFTHVVSLEQFLGETRAHAHTSLDRSGAEVSLPLLPSGGGLIRM